jgi:hypothetical protein
MVNILINPSNRPSTSIKERTRFEQNLAQVIVWRLEYATCAVDLRLSLIRIVKWATEVSKEWRRRDLAIIIATVNGNKTLNDLTAQIWKPNTKPRLMVDSYETRFEFALRTYISSLKGITKAILSSEYT